MSKGKDLHKQLKKQLKAAEEQIETLGEQAAAIEAATVERAQERLVSLVDAMDAQLKVWQNGMTEVNSMPKRAKTDKTVATLTAETPSKTPDKTTGKTTGEATGKTPSEIATLWSSMETQIQQWQTITATMRMTVGADTLVQLATLRSLNTTASEKLHTLKEAQNGSYALSEKAAEQALDDLKDALAHVFPA